MQIWINFYNYILLFPCPVSYRITDDLNTVGIWNPTIRKPESFENRTFWRSTFEWSGFQMVGTPVHTIWKPTIWKPDFLASLDHFKNKEKNILIQKGLD